MSKIGDPLNLLSRHADAKDFAQFSGYYLSYFRDLFESIQSESLNQLCEDLLSCRKQGRTVFIAGNGGSASTAAHMAHDLTVSSPSDSAVAPLRCLDLVSCTPIISAYANDHGYADIFRKQLENAYRSGDRLIVISASGNSENLLRAADYVRAQGGKVIALLGFDGGLLAQKADIVVHARSEIGAYGPVEDIHLMISHMLHVWLKHRTSASG